MCHLGYLELFQKQSRPSYAGLGCAAAAILYTEGVTLPSDLGATSEIVH